MTEQDRDDLQAQCNDLHRQLTEWAQTTDALQDVFFDEDGSQNADFVEGHRRRRDRHHCHLPRHFFWDTLFKTMLPSVMAARDALRRQLQIGSLASATWTWRRD